LTFVDTCVCVLLMLAMTFYC